MNDSEKAAVKNYCEICKGECKGQWAELFDWLEHQVKEHGKENVLKWMKLADEERKNKAT